MNIKKISLFGSLALLVVLAAFATQAFANPPKEHGKPPFIQRVGVVTAYTAGSSITIQAHDGNSYTFSLPAHVMILPPWRANQLGVGSLVTIIARRDPRNGGGWLVFGIVVHPMATATPTATATPLPTDTMTPTEMPTATAVPTGTPTP